MGCRYMQLYNTIFRVEQVKSLPAIERFVQKSLLILFAARQYDTRLQADWVPLE